MINDFILSLRLKEILMLNKTAKREIISLLQRSIKEDNLNEDLHFLLTNTEY